MKKLLLTLLALSSAGLHAQTNTNAFVVTPSAPLTIQAAAPAVVVSSLTVQRILIDSVNQRMTIWFAGIAKPVVVTGPAFAAFKASFQGTFGAAIAAYLQANPPAQ